MKLKNLALMSALSLASAAGLAEGAMPEPSNNGFFAALGVSNAVGPNAVTTGLVINNLTFGNNSNGPWFPLRNLGYVGALAELGYDFTNYFGVEAYGTYLGNQKALSIGAPSTAGTSLYSWAFGGNLIAYMPFEQYKADLFLRAGLGGMYSKLTLGASNFSTTVANQTLSTTQGIYDFGVGALYHWTDHVMLRASWDQFARWNDKTIANVRYNLWTVGVGYQF